MNAVFRVLLPLVILLGGVVAYFVLSGREREPRRRPVVEQVLYVRGEALATKSYSVRLQSRGTLQAQNRTRLFAQVQAVVLKVADSFAKGLPFKKGEVLFELEAVDFVQAHAMARAALQQSEAVLEQEEARAGQAKANWESLGRKEKPSAMVLREPQLLEAKAAVEMRKAELERAKLDLERTKVRAPYDGVWLSRSANVGQPVGGNTELAEIAQVGSLEIALPLSEAQWGMLGKGWRGREVSLKGMQDDQDRKDGQDSESGLKGELVRLQKELDEQTRRRVVFARVEGGAQGAVLGQWWKAEITGKTLEDVFLLPRVAVKAGGSVSLVDAEGRLRVLSVRPIWEDEEWYVVPTKGHEELVRVAGEGWKVVTTTVSYAAEGAKVVVLGEGEKPPTNVAKPGGKKGGKKREKAEKAKS